jgi:hypothetical protein
MSCRVGKVTVTDFDMFYDRLYIRQYLTLYIRQLITGSSLAKLMLKYYLHPDNRQVEFYSVPIRVRKKGKNLINCSG